MSKVRVLGLDGGAFPVIDFLISQGRLPNFARLMENGSRAILESTAPPITWPAWASFYTGTNPGKTGAADLFKFRPGTYQLEPMNAGNLRGIPLWSHASNHGRRVCVYNVPVTYPAIPVNGILISGLDAPHFDERSVYPAGFRHELLHAVPDFRISFENDAKYLVNHHKEPVREWIRQANAYLDIEIRTINYLMRLEDWDLFVAVVRSTDIFQHTMWKAAEKVMNGEPVTEEERMRAESVFGCYERVDRELGDGRSNGWAANTELVIMSDHGFGSLEGCVCLNRVLADQGLLKFHSTGGRGRLRTAVAKSFRTHVPAGMRHRIKALLGKEKDSDPWSAYVDVLVADIDWTQTRIAAIGGFGCLFLNLKGRDPMGVVGGEAEQQAVLAEAEQALMSLRHPVDGKPLVKRFYRKQELYQGPLAHELPDLVVDLRDWSYCPVIGTASELAEEALIRPPVPEWKQLAHTGTHRREGILVLYGPSIATADIGTVPMVDVAPTVVNLMGLPPLPEYDGRVLTGAMAGGEALAASGAAPVAVAEVAGRSAEKTYSEEDEEEIRKRLQNLGYL